MSVAARMGTRPQELPGWGPVIFYTKGEKTLAGGRARHARLHFLRRNIFDVRANRPLVAERIKKSSGTIAVELVFNRPQDFGSRGNGLFW